MENMIVSAISGSITGGICSSLVIKYYEHKLKKNIISYQAKVDAILTTAREKQQAVTKLWILISQVVSRCEDYPILQDLNGITQKEMSCKLHSLELSADKLHKYITENENLIEKCIISSCRALLKEASPEAYESINREEISKLRKELLQQINSITSL